MNTNKFFLIFFVAIINCGNAENQVANQVPKKIPKEEINKCKAEQIISIGGHVKNGGVFKKCVGLSVLEYIEAAGGVDKSSVKNNALDFKYVVLYRVPEISGKFRQKIEDGFRAKVDKITGNVICISVVVINKENDASSE